MNRAVRRDLFWFAALVLALFGIRALLYANETVVFEGALPDDAEAITPLFQVRRDTGLQLTVTRSEGSKAQPLEVELVDADGRLLGHEPMFVEAAPGASDSLLFAVEKGEASVRVLREIAARDPLRITVTSGSQSRQTFSLAFLALLAPPLLRLATKRRTKRLTTEEERSDHGT